MSIPTGQFSHANLEYIRVGSAVAPGADYVLQQQAAVVASVATGQVLNILLPDISKSPFGPSIYFLRWNGLGTLTFAVVAGSPDVIRPAGATSYAETSPANAIDFLILATDGVYRIIAIHESGTSGGVNATAPNVQVVANAMDTGHEMGDTTLFLAPTIGGASKPATMGASSVCLADAGGLAIGAGSVSVGILGNDVEANGVVCGSSNGLVQSGACVLGHATGTLGDGEIFLGSGEATGTAGAITLCDVARMYFIIILRWAMVHAIAPRLTLFICSYYCWRYCYHYWWIACKHQWSCSIHYAFYRCSHPLNPNNKMQLRSPIHKQMGTITIFLL